MKTTKVLLREEQTTRQIPITSHHHPRIEAETMDRWQHIVNLVCQILGIPTGLIMKITENHMEVFLKSTNPDNPYPTNGKDALGLGLYCETVIGRDASLEMVNALENHHWKDNPDVARQMISYLGFPIKWPDEEFFGTICVLDSKEHYFSPEYKALLEELKNTIELDLQLLTKNEELNYLAETDSLTQIYNRRKIEAIAENEFRRSNRTKQAYSVVLLDLDNFKHINDTFGHSAGDKTLQLFAHTILERIRETDFVGRWGGDEFLLICPNTDAQGIQTLMENLHQATVPHLQKISSQVDFTYGCSTFSHDDSDYTNVIDRADKNLYKNKK